MAVGQENVMNTNIFDESLSNWSTAPCPLPFAAQLCQNQRRIMKIRGATMALDQTAVRKVLAGVACPGWHFQ
jgi:hypothetical protein